MLKRGKERVTWLVPIVTRALVGGAVESETGVGSLSCFSPVERAH